MIKTPLSTVIGGAFWTQGCTVIGGQQSFSQLIKKLFSNGEQGFFYDPNDLSTMYQDAAGTVPVTAAGQPVGLVLDKSKQLSFTPRINFIAYSNVFSDIAWRKLEGVTVTDNQVVAPDGTTSAAQVIGNTNKRNGVFQLAVNKMPLGTIVTRSIYLRSVTGVQTVNLVDPALTVETVVCNLTETWQRFSLTEAADHQCGIWIQNIQAAGIYVWGAQVEVGSIASTYQQTNQWPVDWLGNHAYQTTSAAQSILRQNAVTGANYLEFDGSDDFLQTNNIDFTATDKVSLFAGVRNLIDNPQIIAELSANTNLNSGSFYFVAGTNGVVGYTSLSRGTFAASVGNRAGISPYLAPDTAVISAKHDISVSLSSIRRNGIVGIDGTDAKGTGNFGNYPLYIGRRAGTSLPFNGHLYGLIGIGRLTTDSETAAIEKELAKRTGVTLNV